MNRDRRIQGAIALLNARANENGRQQIESAVDAVLNFERLQRSGLDPSDTYRPKDKSEKENAKQLVRAMDRVDNLLTGLVAGSALQKVARIAFSDDELPIWLRQMRQLRETLEPYPNPNAGHLFPPGKGFAQQQLKSAPRMRTSRKRPGATSNFQLKRRAVEEAAQLLEFFGLPLTLYRNGRFCRLAAILSGDAAANLYHQCGTFRAGRNKQ